GPVGDELEVPHREAARQETEHRDQTTGAPGPVDDPVELVVPARLVLGVGGGDERLVDAAQVRELLVAQRGGGATAGETGDEPEDAVVVDDVGPLEAGDEGTAPRHRVDEALLRELDERLPHRQPTDAERLADLVLIDLGTGRELTGEDLLP